MQKFQYVMRANATEHGNQNGPNARVNREDGGGRCKKVVTRRQKRKQEKTTSGK
jgi:hypothetical protein